MNLSLTIIDSSIFQIELLRVCWKKSTKLALIPTLSFTYKYLFIFFITNIIIKKGNLYMFQKVDFKSLSKKRGAILTWSISKYIHYTTYTIPRIFVNVKNFSIFLPENGRWWRSFGSSTNQTSCSTFDHVSIFGFQTEFIPEYCNKK